MTTEPLTKKYRRFVVGGFSRVLISRTFSFLYVIIVTRLIIKGTMDQMIILASGQLIILQVTSLAMRFSCRQRALSVKGEKSDEFRYNGVLFMLFIATPISIILAVIMALYVGGFEYTVLLISYPLSMALIMLMETEIMVEKSLLAADRAILLNMVFSVLNSIMVPLFYFIAPTLASVLWAWNFSLVLTVLLDIKVILRILQKKRLSSQVITYLIHFGFPIYLGQLPQLISTHINNFVIFEFLETGATSIFYWPNRILSMIREAIFIVGTGSTLLFNRLYATDKEKLRDTFLGLFRSYVVISTIIYSWVYLDATILIYLLLGEGYTEAISFFRLLCLAWYLSTIVSAMTALKDGIGHRRVVVKGNLFNFLSKTFLLIILLQFGLIGIVFTEIIAACLFFAYYIKNTPFLHTNDNFIRLGIFMFILFILAQMGILFEMTDFLILALINVCYGVIALICIFIMRPLTTRDMIFIEKVIPQKLQWFLSYYHPSKSRFDQE